MKLRVDHVHAVAVDMDKSIPFYEMLGFKLLRRVEFGPDSDRRQIAYVGNEHSVIELVMPRDPDNPLGGGTGVRPFAMTVEDMDATIAELEANGVEVIQAPGPGFSFTGRSAAIKDPSGVAIELREWAPTDTGYPGGWVPKREDVVNITP